MGRSWKKKTIKWKERVSKLFYFLGILNKFTIFEIKKEKEKKDKREKCWLVYTSKGTNISYGNINLDFAGKKKGSAMLTELRRY